MQWDLLLVTQAQKLLGLHTSKSMCIKLWMYFRISLGWDKYKWGKWSLLLISRGAPHKVRYQSLEFDCKCYITPFFSCLITIWRCWVLFSPFIFVPSKRNSKVCHAMMTRDQVMLFKWHSLCHVCESVYYTVGCTSTL